ncbi:HNH endonuclease [Yersinia ruckeri]|nr:HNH endonuclease [Yersinia ruckeri]
MNTKEKTSTSGGRFNTTDEVRRIVWIRTAGHCELCGVDLTHDYRVGTPMRWGEVAHILPASPKGPRGNVDHSDDRALALTNNFANLMLLCPGCHDRIDRDEDGYPENDLSGLHQACLERIRLAASSPGEGRAIPVIVQSQHFATTNNIPVSDLLMVMSSEGLSAFGHPISIIFPAPGPRGRDLYYWQNVKDDIHYKLAGELVRRGGMYGDLPALAVIGVADIPALMLLGQAIGDRTKRFLFSMSRSHGLRWPDKSAEPPDFLFSSAPEGKGPLALVISISAKISPRDVMKAIPDARIAEFTIPEPAYAIVSCREVIHAFRDELQKRLSQLEASTDEAIHVFAAIPAALAIEFGALLTTQHQHPYVIFDRENMSQNQFRPMLTIGHSQEL